MAEEIMKKVNLFGQDYILKGSGGAAGGTGGGVWPSQAELM